MVYIAMHPSFAAALVKSWQHVNVHIHVYVLSMWGHAAAKAIPGIPGAQVILPLTGQHTCQA